MGEFNDISAFGVPVIAPLPEISTARPTPDYSNLSRKDSLMLWHRVTLQSVKNNTPDLTARQMAVLMSVYLEERPQTVRSLAAKLGVTKAVITRAIDKLCKLDFVRRAPDHRDKRSIILTRTGPGIRYLSSFAETIQSQLPSPDRY